MATSENLIFRTMSNFRKFLEKNVQRLPRDYQAGIDTWSNLRTFYVENAALRCQKGSSLHAQIGTLLWKD